MGRPEEWERRDRMVESGHEREAQWKLCRGRSACIERTTMSAGFAGQENRCEDEVGLVS